MRFRRRRKGGMWLPPDLSNRIAAPNGQTLITSPGDGAIGHYFMTLSTPTNGATWGVNIALVGDLNETTLPGSGAGSTLADFATGYSLKRVVGKLFVSMEQQVFAQGEDVPYNFMATAGIIVRHVSDAGLPFDVTGPQQYESWTDPWLWRRSWMLCNQAQAQSSGGFLPYPSNNAAYGSVADGPHCDAKTRRTIKAEERLYLVLQTTCIHGTDVIAPGDMYMTFDWDFRFFGSVFQSRGNRRNAAR